MNHVPSESCTLKPSGTPRDANGRELKPACPVGANHSKTAEQFLKESSVVLDDERGVGLVQFSR